MNRGQSPSKFMRLSILAVLGLVAITGYTVWRMSRWETEVASSEMLHSLWDDDYAVPEDPPSLAIIWPMGLTKGQRDVISNCSKVYVAILNDATGTRSTSGQHELFHGERISRVVAVKDVKRFCDVFIRNLTQKTYWIDDREGHIRYGIRFEMTTSNSSEAEVVDVSLAEAYAVAWIHSKSDLRYVICERELFEVARAVLRDTERPEFVSDL